MKKLRLSLIFNEREEEGEEKEEDTMGPGPIRGGFEISPPDPSRIRRFLCFIEVTIGNESNEDFYIFHFMDDDSARTRNHSMSLFGFTFCKYVKSMKNV